MCWRLQLGSRVTRYQRRMVRQYPEPGILVTPDDERETRWHGDRLALHIGERVGPGTQMEAVAGPGAHRAPLHPQAIFLEQLFKVFPDQPRTVPKSVRERAPQHCFIRIEADDIFQVALIEKPLPFVQDLIRFH